MQVKKALRDAAVARREESSPAQRTAAGTALAVALAEVLGTAQRVAAYVAVGTEPPTAALMGACHNVLLPILLPNGDLDWGSAGDLRRGPHGLLEPAGRRLGVEAISDCDVVLVPALAVDGAGHRLGRGGGSYDRALRRCSGLTIALLYDGEQVAALPVEPHDEPVRAVASPSAGLTRFG